MWVSDYVSSSSSSWERGPDMEVPRRSPAVAAFKGRIFVMGGTDLTTRGTINTSGVTSTKSTEIFDVASQRWERGPNMLTPRAASSAVVLHNKLYIVAGLGTAARSSVEILSEEGDRWEGGPPLQNNRECSTAAVLNNSLYVIGSREKESCHTTEVLRGPLYNLWVNGPELNRGRVFAASAVFDGCIYVMGGVSWPDDTLDSVEFLCEGSLAMFMFAWPMGTPRSHHCAVVLRDSLYVLGGTTSNWLGNSLDSVETFTKGEEQWVRGDTLDMRLADAGSVVLDNTCFVIGGWINTFFTWGPVQKSVRMLKERSSASSADPPFQDHGQPSAIVFGMPIDDNEDEQTLKTWLRYVDPNPPERIPPPDMFTEKSLKPKDVHGLTGLLYAYYDADKFVTRHCVATMEERDMPAETVDLNRLHLRMVDKIVNDLRFSRRIGPFAKLTWCIGFAIGADGSVRRNSCANMFFSGSRTLMVEQAVGVGKVLATCGYEVAA